MAYYHKLVRTFTPQDPPSALCLRVSTLTRTQARTQAHRLLSVANSILQFELFDFLLLCRRHRRSVFAVRPNILALAASRSEPVPRPEDQHHL